jgi:hypothetical protein
MLHFADWYGLFKTARYENNSDTATMYQIDLQSLWTRDIAQVRMKPGRSKNPSKRHLLASNKKAGGWPRSRERPSLHKNRVPVVEVLVVENDVEK